MSTKQISLNLICEFKYCRKPFKREPTDIHRMQRFCKRPECVEARHRLFKIDSSKRHQKLNKKPKAIITKIYPLKECHRCGSDTRNRLGYCSGCVSYISQSMDLNMMRYC